MLRANGVCVEPRGPARPALCDDPADKKRGRDAFAEDEAIANFAHSPPPRAATQPATTGTDLLAAESFWAWEQDRRLRYTHVLPVATGPTFDPRRIVGRARWDLPEARPLAGTWADHRNVLAERLPFQNFRYLVFAGTTTPRCLAESGEPQFDGAGNFAGYRGTTREVTQQWLQQCRLREAEAMLGVAAALARFGAWAMDVESGRLTWTREIAAIHDQRAEHCAASPDELLALYAPEHRGMLRQAYVACVRDGRPFDLEVQALTARGRRMWVRIIGTPVRGPGGEVTRVQGAYQDIHKAKAAAEDHRERAQRLRTTLDSLADGFLTVDRQWRITYANPAAESILAMRADALQHRILWEAFPGLDQTEFAGHYRAAMDEGRQTRCEAFYTPLAQWFRVSAFPSRQGIAISFTDITAAREMHQRLLQANAQLEQRAVERTGELRRTNEELASFTHAVAQDLRAPLAAIDGFSRALAERLPAEAGSTPRHYAARIRAGVARMHGLLDALLELARVGGAGIDARRVDLTAIARCTVEALRASEAGRDVVVDVQEGLFAVGDARLLRILLENLIGNAWKFSAARHPARIEVGRRDDGAFFVRDNGIGLCQERVDALFPAAPRLHTDTGAGGLGIGLASARRVAERHGGRLWAEAAADAGAMFCFTLGGREGEPPS